MSTLTAYRMERAKDPRSKKLVCYELNLPLNRFSEVPGALDIDGKLTSNLPWLADDGSILTE